MGWSITPSDLASIDSNGNVTFSQHTERDITYTITYSDANFTCTKACTVYKCPDPCTCANANLNVAVAPDGASIPASGYTSSKTIGTYNFSTCLKSITATSNKGWVTDITVGSGNITAKISENTSLTSSRTAIITVTGKDDEDNDCTGACTVTQEMSANTCPCSVFTVTPREGCVPVLAGTENLGTYADGGCITNITASNLPSWLSNVTFSNGTISGVVTKNDSYEQRSATITVTGKDGANESCPLPLRVCQNGKSKYSCDDVIFKNQMDENRFMFSAYTDVLIGTVTVPVGFFDEAEVVSSSPNTVVRPLIGPTPVSTNRESYTIKVNLLQVNDDESCVIGIDVPSAGMTCELCQILRVCPCGMDNCVETAGEIPIDYKLYVNSYISVSSTTYAGQTLIEHPSNGDSILVPEGTLYYNGSVVSGNGGVYADSILTIPNPDGTDSHVAYNYTGWTAHFTGTHGGEGYMYCFDNRMVMYNFEPNFTEYERDFYLTYTVSPTGTTITRGPRADWLGSIACSEFKVHIVQAPCGYHYVKSPDEKDPITGENIRVLECLNYPDPYGNGCCSCCTGPTYYTYVVNSDVNGALVQFYNSDKSQLYDSKTIQNGTCRTRLQYTPITVVISKSDCTFSPSEASMSSSVSSTTLNGNCSAPPAECNISMNLINNADAAGSSNMYIGGYNTTGSCTVSSTLTYVSGNGDFLTSTSVQNNGGIYASVAQNTSASPRTSRYRISYGTATAEADITQLGATPTTYTYTVNSTDDNANGADVGFYDGSGTMITSSTISNRTCSVTLSTYYASLSVGIAKTNCDSIRTTVNANSSVSITMSCSTPDPCTLSVSITPPDGILPGAGGCKVIGTFTTGGSCAGQTPTATFVPGVGSTDFVTAWTFNTTTGYITACANYNTSPTYSKLGAYKISVGDASQTITVAQAANSCLNAEAPDFNTTAFTHPHNSMNVSYHSEFTSSCWTISDVSTVLDPPGYVFASAYSSAVGDRKIVTITCNAGQSGYNATVNVQLTSTDGSGRTATKTIKVTWV